MTPEQELLVTTHLKFVPAIVNTWYLSNRPANVLLTPEELLAEGYLALVKAAMSYKPGKTTTFQRYINDKIRWHIKDYLRKNDVLTRKDRKTFKTKVPKELTVNYKTGFPKIDNMMFAKNNKTQDVTWEQYHEHTPEHAVNSKEAVQLIRTLGNKQLGKRNTDILFKTIVGEINYKDIAKTHKLTRPRVSQIVTRNITVLRKALRQRGFTQTKQLL